MNVIISLGGESSTRKPELGDVVKLQLFFDEQVGSPGDGWEVIAPPNTAWLQAGGVTVATMSVRAKPADGNATKLELDAMVHQPGPLVVGPFQLRNQVTKAELDVPQTVVAGTETSAGTKPQQEPPWILGPVNFGGWDWALLGVLLALLLALGIVISRILYRRFRKQMGGNLNHTERALQSLGNLQKYLRSGKPLELEEWKKFSFELAGILRKFSDENFLIDSRDMTDREFLQELNTHASAAAHVNLLASLLGTITEVRYGRKNLNASVIPGLLLDAKKFIESTSSIKNEEAKK